jgi:20S proteasome subunit beta 7
MEAFAVQHREKNKTMEDRKHTTSPIVTGTSVLGIKYNGGVMLIADTLASYGSMARFMNVPRISKVNKNTVIGGGGEYSDLQAIKRLLHELTLEDFLANDGREVGPSEVHRYLTRVMYQKRTKVDPLYNQILVGGFDSGKP